MKKNYSTLKLIFKNMLVVLFIVFLSINGSAQWTNVTTTNVSTPSTYASWASSSAVVGDTLYMICGSPAGGNWGTREFWKYCVSTKTWKHFGTHPASGKTATFAFAVNGKAYFGSGDIGGLPYTDFWEYNPSSGSWTKKADIPQGKTCGSAFVIGNKGYVGLGSNNSGGSYFTQFYEYDPIGNNWTTKDNFIGLPRNQAAQFVINGIAYVGLGMTNSSAFNDFYSFDPTAATGLQWKSVASIPGTGSAAVSNFSICNKGFIVFGANGTNFGNPINDFWMFDPTAASGGVWIKLADFSGTARSMAQSFTTGNTAYITIGYDGTSALADMWSYTPSLTLNSISPAVTICAGASTPLTVDGNSFYNWSPSTTLSASQTSGSSISTGVHQTTASPLTTTTYTVTEAICQVQQDSVKVTVNYATTDAGNDTTICNGTDANLLAATANTYSWSPAASLSCNNCQNPIATPDTTTAYYLQVTDNAGCIAKDTVTITVLPPAVVNAGSDVSICNGSSTILSATTNVTYSWSPATGLNCTDCKSPIATPLNTTPYYVEVTDNNGCIGKDTIIVTVNPLPLVDFNTSSAECNLQFNNSSTGAINYLWDFGDGTTAQDENPEHLYNTVGTYTITLTAISDSGCTSTHSLDQEINSLGSTLFIPNGFTPNGDGINDVFMVGSNALTEFEATIYNRWGEKIASWSDSKMGWDGTTKGKIADEGVYTYVIKAKSQCSGDTYNYTGMVVLLK